METCVFFFLGLIFPLVTKAELDKKIFYMLWLSV